jgi:hypothetical protein
MLSAACYVCSQREPGRKTNRKGKTRFGRDSPGVDIVLRECAELIDQLPVIVEARFKRSARLMIEQPRADTVTDLTPTTLPIGSACRVEAQLIEVGLAAAIKKMEWHRSVSSPNVCCEEGRSSKVPVFCSVGLTPNSSSRSVSVLAMILAP